MKTHHILYMILVLAIKSSPLFAQEPDPNDVYDLRIGVERLFGLCYNFPPYMDCAIEENFKLEKVIGSVEIQGKTYAEVQVYSILIGSQPFHVPKEIIYYRLEGHKLYRMKDGEELLWFDFSATVANRATDIVKVSTGHYGYRVSEIVVKTDLLVDFPDGSTYRMVFGNNAEGQITNEEFTNDYLVDEFSLASNEAGVFIMAMNWILPFRYMYSYETVQEFTESPSTFLYISRFGVVLTPIGENSEMLIAFKGHNGVHYGIEDVYFTNIDFSDNDLPEDIELYQNYPNPFNPTTNISFTLFESDQVTIKVFDVLGRQVSVLIDETLGAGRHNVVFNARGLSSGVYLYELRHSHGTLSGKLLLTK